MSIELAQPDLTEHLTVESDVMHCKHCGYKEQLKNPQSIDGFVKQMERFELNHEQCKPLPKTRGGTEHYFDGKGQEYAKGFDHGCDYLMVEIERYYKENASRDIALLILRLKGVSGK